MDRSPELHETTEHNSFSYVQCWESPFFGLDLFTQLKYCGKIHTIIGYQWISTLMLYYSVSYLFLLNDEYFSLKSVFYNLLIIRQTCMGSET